MIVADMREYFNDRSGIMAHRYFFEKGHFFESALFYEDLIGEEQRFRDIPLEKSAQRNDNKMRRS